MSRSKSSSHGPKPQLRATALRPLPGAQLLRWVGGIQTVGLSADRVIVRTEKNASPSPPVSRNSEGISGATVALIVLGVVAVGVLIGIGLAVWAAYSVVSDDLDPENSPTIQRIEAEHPVMHDLNLETGDRTKYARSGGEPGLISLSYETGSWHIQEFTPLPGWTLDDVALEIVERAEAEGYELVQDEEIWCSTIRDGLVLKQPLKVQIVAVDPAPVVSDDFDPHVKLSLTANCR